MAATPTPMMAQYLKLKDAHRDHLLLYRMGDFYELFFEDAEVAAACLNIALTARGQHGGDPIPMCGVPYHSVDQYMRKLMAAGHRVALCEQTEDPAEAKKRGGSKAVVAREVVRILTPGTLTEDAYLEAGRAAFLAALGQASGRQALAWIDLSTGTFQVQALPHPARAVDLEAALVQIDPGEVLAADTLLDDPVLGSALQALKNRLTPQPAARFSSNAGAARLKKLFGVADLTSFGDLSRAEVSAAGALIDYVDLTQKAARPIIKPLKQNLAAGQLSIDAATRRNLELTETLAGKRAGSLLATIDRTLTGAGARLLGDRLARPSAHLALIEERQESLAYFLDAPDLRADVRAYLKSLPDLARAVQRLALGRGGPRDMIALAATLDRAGQLRRRLAAARAKFALGAELQRAFADLGDFDALGQILTQALQDEVPLLARDGGFVRPGFRADLDAQRALRDESRSLIAAMQADLVQRTGIASLKIKHNNVLGYFIEVTSANADKMPSDPSAGFIHRQTLASATRYTTLELSELEEKIRAAGERTLALELEVYENLRRDLLDQSQGLMHLADALAVLDLSAALAHLAEAEAWVRPTLDKSHDLVIVEGRHPVVERALASASGPGFMANSLAQGPQDHIWLLTGPNMAGKSTYLRQNALIIILAQMGAFVPAASAHIGLVDRLFSRVGASDDLASGRSTFMVEMVETAMILNQATAQSFVILDEIGRGTATYDGLSIAWATVEYLATHSRCRALFATHYHELTALAERLPALTCHSAQVKEWQGEVIFLHQIAPGAADRSYGIHVGKLAGLPAPVLARAQEVLDHLERDKQAGDLDLPLFSATTRAPSAHAAPSSPATNPALQVLLDLDVDALTPREALERLYTLKDLADA